jgi:hypothetical protein
LLVGWWVSTGGSMWWPSILFVWELGILQRDGRKYFKNHNMYLRLEEKNKQNLNGYLCSWLITSKVCTMQRFFCVNITNIIGRIFCQFTQPFTNSEIGISNIWKIKGILLKTKIVMGDYYFLFEIVFESPKNIPMRHVFT